MSTRPITLDPPTLRWCAEQLERMSRQITRGDDIGNQAKHWLDDHSRSFRASAGSIERRRARAGEGVAIDAIRGRTPDEIRGLLSEFVAVTFVQSAVIRTQLEEGCSCSPGTECIPCAAARLITQAVEILP